MAGLWRSRKPPGATAAAAPFRGFFGPPLRASRPTPPEGAARLVPLYKGSMSRASLLGATKSIFRTFLGRGLLATALLLAAARLAWGWAPPAEPGADYLFLDPSERILAVQPLIGSTTELGE